MALEFFDRKVRLGEEVCSPFRVVILDKRHQPTVYPGDWAFHCGRL